MPLLESLLANVSRTFALSIPRLPEPLRTEITLAYLLMRIADTFEDTTTAPFSARVAGLDAFCALMSTPNCAESLAALQHAAAHVRPDHAGERAVLDHADDVLVAFCAVRPAARNTIRHTCHEMAEGMRAAIDRTDERGFTHMGSLSELRDYCYVVAAIVGRMLTQLYLIEQPELAPVRYSLHERALAFGEGVQLVNILKDVQADAIEKRSFLPPDVPLQTLFALARADLQKASEYVQLLRHGGASDGVVAFNQITLRLGFAALDITEARGSGAKISRRQVERILAAAP